MTDPTDPTEARDTRDTRDARIDLYAQMAHYVTPDTLPDHLRFVLVVEDRWLRQESARAMDAIPDLAESVRASFRRDLRYHVSGRRRTLHLPHLTARQAVDMIAALERTDADNRYRLVLTELAASLLPKPLTMLDLGMALGVQADPSTGFIPAGEFDRLGFSVIGGCAVCGATIAVHNACPSHSGYWKCASGCIGDDGFYTVHEFEQAWDAAFAEDAAWDAGG